jgi:hypothetical protein
MSAGSTGFAKLAQTTVLASFIAIPANDVWAKEGFTAGKVVKELNPSQLYLYMTGIVEGLAYSRYIKDGQNTEGMNCIYSWFYDDKDMAYTITAAFEKYPDHLPGTIVAALAKQKCGE